MDYKRLKRLIGALMTATAAFTLLWVLWGRDVQGIGLIAVAVLLALGGLMHLFAPGQEPQEPKSVLTQLVTEAKSAAPAQETLAAEKPKGGQNKDPNKGGQKKTAQKSDQKKAS